MLVLAGISHASGGQQVVRWPRMSSSCNNWALSHVASTPSWASSQSSRVLKDRAGCSRLPEAQTPSCHTIISATFYWSKEVTGPTWFPLKENIAKTHKNYIYMGAEGRENWGHGCQQFIPMWKDSVP